MITAKMFPSPKHEDENLSGTSTQEGSKKTKQEEGKRRKRVRDAHLQRNSYCLDSRGSHREPCHRVAYGNVVLCKLSSVMCDNGKLQGQKQVFFSTAMIYLMHLNSLTLMVEKW